MRVAVTQQILDRLDRHNISTHYRGLPRWNIGDFLSFDPHATIEPYVGIYAGFGLCRMGYMSYANSALPVDIAIGRYCSIGPGVRFVGGRHPLEYVSTSVFTHAPELDIVARFVKDSGGGYNAFLANPQRAPVKIENDVWIGTGAMLMSGITLGTGSAVAAGSVVTKSVAPYDIVGGNPARPIRKRFPEDIAAALLRAEWWRYKFTDFEKLDLAQPERFLAQFETVKNALEPYRPTPIALAEIFDVPATGA
ncbi:MAG TPA: CatB-related O-acetyltransferase [Stellaceae bacterium]|jgi:acetyltransferase-like isoleucine patch superfamily enzyme|nr:CatB-related O-acetyltransferase [Stellaceae bacterium]